MSIFKGRRFWRQPKVCYIQLGLADNQKKSSKEERKEPAAATAETAREADPQQRGQEEKGSQP